MKGVRSAKVNWKTKNAKVEFDENEVSAQALTQLIHETPHMMGSDHDYVGWLSLRVPEMADEEYGNRVKETGKELPGVKSVAIFLPQKAIGILFDDEGSLTTAEVIEELEKAEIKASNF